MYADHHVLRVREKLFALDGVAKVYASSAWHTVIVSYDPDKIQLEAIEQALADYTSSEGTPILAETGENHKDLAWDALGVRVTRTNEADLRMSGEFRKY
jgi:copper chaperone CopZ